MMSSIQSAMASPSILFYSLFTRSQPPLKIRLTGTRQHPRLGIASCDARMYVRPRKRTFTAWSYELLLLRPGNERNTFCQKAPNDTATFTIKHRATSKVHADNASDCASCQPAHSWHNVRVPPLSKTTPCLPRDERYYY